MPIESWLASDANSERSRSENPLCRRVSSTPAGLSLTVSGAGEDRLVQRDRLHAAPVLDGFLRPARHVVGDPPASGPSRARRGTAGARRRAGRPRTPSPPNPAATRCTARCSRSCSSRRTRDSCPIATSVASRPICSRSARSASAARPSTAVWPSVSPNRVSIPAVIRLHLARRDLPRLLPAQRADQRLQRGLVLGADRPDRLLRAHPVEEPGGGALAAVADVGAVGDVAERQHHQHVPQPPGQVPVRGERHGDHRLGEQDVRRDDRQQHHRAAPAVDQVEADGDEHVERHGTAVTAISGPLSCAAIAGSRRGGRPAREKMPHTAASV